MDNVIEYGSFLSIEFSKICGSFVNAFQGNFVVVIISCLVRGRFFYHYYYTIYHYNVFFTKVQRSYSMRNIFRHTFRHL